MVIAYGESAAIFGPMFFISSAFESGRDGRGGSFTRRATPAGCVSCRWLRALGFLAARSAMKHERRNRRRAAQGGGERSRQGACRQQNARNRERFQALGGRCLERR